MYLCSHHIAQRGEKSIGGGEEEHLRCFSLCICIFFKVFATFCGLGIHNVMIYERIAIASARKKVALDILSYHASSSIDEVGRLQVCVLGKPIVHD